MTILKFTVTSLFPAVSLLTLDNSVFNGTSVRSPVVDEVLEDVLGRLGLAGAALAAHDDRLTLLQHLHVAVRLVRCNNITTPSLNF